MEDKKNYNLLLTMIIVVMFAVYLGYMDGRSDKNYADVVNPIKE